MLIKCTSALQAQWHNHKTYIKTSMCLIVFQKITYISCFARFATFKFCHVFACVFSMFDNQAPRWSQVSPKCSHDSPKKAPARPKMAPATLKLITICAEEAPKSSQDSPKMASTWPIIAPRQHVFIIHHSMACHIQHTVLIPGPAECAVAIE